MISDKDDIIDEVLTLFRANVLFRNFEVQGGADRTMIYLTLHVVQCLVKCERIEDKQLGLHNFLNCHFLFVLILSIFLKYVAIKELRALSTKGFPGPGENGWTLGGLFPAPANATEANLWKTYMKQAREELALRLCDRLFDGPAAKNKWWQVRNVVCNNYIFGFRSRCSYYLSILQSFSKRKFMGKELKD